MKTRVLMRIGRVRSVGEMGEGEICDGVLGLGFGGGEERARRCCAVRRGPMVFVWRWWANAENVLGE